MACSGLGESASAPGLSYGLAAAGSDSACGAYFTRSDERLSDGDSAIVGLLPMASLRPFAEKSWGSLSDQDNLWRHSSSESSLMDSLTSFGSDPGHPLIAKVFSEDRILLMLMLLLGPPVVACALLSLNTSALYWIGDVGLTSAAGALLWATVGQVVMHRRLLTRRTSCVLAVVVPTAGLLWAAHTHRTYAVYFSSRLHNKECGTSFHAKNHLQKAWLAADKIHAQCVSTRANVSEGVVADSQVEAVQPVSHCPGYEEGLETWGSEWAYLEALEGSHHCAGWCEFSEKPLWRVFGNPNPQDRCSLAASGVLSGLVYRTAKQVELYCVVLLFGFILISLL